MQPTNSTTNRQIEENVEQRLGGKQVYDIEIVSRAHRTQLSSEDYTRFNPMNNSDC